MFANKYDDDISPSICRTRDIHNRNTTGGDLNLCKDKGKKDIRRLSFRNRVVNTWNELPERIKTAPSVKSFEKRLDRYWKSYKIKYNFDKCIDFEKMRLDPTYAGSGERNIKLTRDEDLEIQAL